MERSGTLLKQLEAARTRFGVDAARAKLDLLRQLERSELENARQVLRLHECLCFLRAHPDTPDLLALVEQLLTNFSRRRDLRRHRRELGDSGIAGTDVHCSFFWSTAKWLVRHWPEQVSINWSEFEKKDELDALLHVIAPFGQSCALDMFDAPLGARGWIDELKGPDETDAAFLIRRLDRVQADDFLRDVLYERLDVPFKIAGSDAGPSRTCASWPGASVEYQTTPFSSARPSLKREIREFRMSVREAPPREARVLIDLWRQSLAVRHRDTLAAENVDKNDVRVVTADRGIQFAFFGVLPARRATLESLYGYLTLRNGVPIGYGTTCNLFQSCEIAYNVFETFRGSEAAWVLARLMGAAHQLFDVDAFSVDAYQLGSGNGEALRSGAWWFYYKLGFRPTDAEIRSVVKEERKLLARNPRHRSSIATLKELSSDGLVFHLGKTRGDLLGRLPTENVGLHVARWIAEHFGSDRERAFRTTSRDAAARLGVLSRSSFSQDERLAWSRWSPLVMMLPGLDRWPAPAKRELASIIRLKGSRRDSDYQRRFDGHDRLRNAIVALTAEVQSTA